MRASAQRGFSFAMWMSRRTSRIGSSCGFIAGRVSGSPSAGSRRSSASATHASRLPGESSHSVSLGNVPLEGRPRVVTFLGAARPSAEPKASTASLNALADASSLTSSARARSSSATVRRAGARVRPRSSCTEHASSISLAASFSAESPLPAAKERNAASMSCWPPLKLITSATSGCALYFRRWHLSSSYMRYTSKSTLPSKVSRVGSAEKSWPSSVPTSSYSSPDLRLRQRREALMCSSDWRAMGTSSSLASSCAPALTKTAARRKARWTSTRTRPSRNSLSVL
mmetsp:Transcript_8909/g.36349  ORF Transcript_8909/g.36349 Transcript_8909/m.36349 type:complete len:285 (+) Transcript_8909:1012-1866(+)